MVSNEESLKHIRPISLASIIQENPFGETEAERLAIKLGQAMPADDSSAFLLLSTKIEIPPVRTNLVQRPRLVKLLNQIQEKKLISITAPAGFGKTTLLSAWASGVGANLPIAWVSLDQGDNMPSRFWLYVKTAIERVSNIEDFLQDNGSSTHVESLLTLLVNSLNKHKEHFVLILDDLHFIDNPQIFAGLSRLLERLPTTMHLVFSSRTLPNLPLSRLRANGESTEMGMDDIRFTEAETAIFFQEVMGLKLSPANLTTLSSRTEGWVAGLQMTAISLQNTENVSQMIESFTGNDRYILDYLMEEVLQHQPENIREFLLETSILSRMTGALCDALLEQHNSWALLESLEKANLFIVALDRERHWYRYHHLFSEFLKDRLMKESPTKLNELHRRASHWFETQNLAQEAIEHAIEANDFTRAMQLIEKISRKIFDYGEERMLNGWLEKLPQAILLQNPRLCLSHTYILVLQNRMSEAEPWLERMEARLDSLEEQSADQRDLQVELNLIKIMKAGMERNIEKTMILAQETLKALPFTTNVDKIRANWVIEFNQGYAFLESRMLHQASERFRNAYTVCQASNTTFYASTVSLDYLSRVQLLQGKLYEALQTNEEILQLSEGKKDFFSWVACRANLSLGTIYYQWDELPKAAEYLNKAILLGDSIGNDDLVIQSMLALLRAVLRQNDVNQALILKNRLTEMLMNTEHPDRLRQLLRAQFHLIQGNLENIDSWLQGGIFQTALPLEYPLEDELLTKTRAWIALERWSEAMDVLTQLQQSAKEKAMDRVLVEAAVLQSVCVKQNRPSPDVAFNLLKDALEVAETHRFLRVFMDEGEPMRQILESFCTAFKAGALYVDDRILKHINRLLVKINTDFVSHSRESLLSDRLLSERETEILKYIASGLSNQETAKLLFITDGTVKKHLSNIFEKLNVHSRTKAIALARKTGII